MVSQLSSRLVPLTSYLSVWEALEEGKMATIADAVSAGFKQKSDEDKEKITANLIKYIVSENNTSHKVRTFRETKYQHLQMIV